MKILKLPKIPNIIWAILVPLLIIVLFVFAALSGPDPLNAYTVNRECTFIEFAGVRAAACDDGSAWLVEPLP